jgi:hypothetical protein
MPKKMYPFKIGKKYLIRTVTYFSLGQLERIDGDFLVLSQASWVADTGRFTQALKDGTLNEVEITGEVYVNVNSIVDAFPWEHELPTKQK